MPSWYPNYTFVQYSSNLQTQTNFCNSALCIIMCFYLWVICWIVRRASLDNWLRLCNHYSFLVVMRRDQFQLGTDQGLSNFCETQTALIILRYCQAKVYTLTHYSVRNNPIDYNIFDFLVSQKKIYIYIFFPWNV